jgi:Domain of unknown function (DUF4920)
MKKVVIIIFIGLLLTACSSEKKEVKISDKVEKSFGPEKVILEELVPTSTMLSKFDGKNGDQEFHFEGKILEVCSKAGCWVRVDDGKGGSFRVMFKDHFTIPVNTPIGTIAYFGGLAYQDTVSVADQQHYLEDAKASKEEIAKIAAPSYEFGFEADAVVLKK